MVNFGSGAVFVNIGRHAAFHIKEVIGIAIDLISRCRGKPHNKRVKIVENSAIFFENRAVSLVNDNEVEMRRRKHTITVFVPLLIDGIHYGGIRRKDNARVSLLFV